MNIHIGGLLLRQDKSPGSSAELGPLKSPAPCGAFCFQRLADVTNIPSLFARAPDWAVVFDMDPNMARATRRRVFDSMVRDRALTGGFHFPFPAFGTMENAGNGYQFKPVA